MWAYKRGKYFLCALPTLHEGLFTVYVYMDLNVVCLWSFAAFLCFATGGLESPYMSMLILAPNWSDLNSKLPLL